MAATEHRQGSGPQDAVTAALQGKLRALLPHWIEHKAEHAAKFRNWAEKVRAAGLEVVTEEIDTAAKELGWDIEALRAAPLQLGRLYEQSAPGALTAAPCFCFGQNSSTWCCSRPWGNGMQKDDYTTRILAG
jgi:hypothetical protein